MLMIYGWYGRYQAEGAAEPSLVATALSQAGGQLDQEDEAALVWAASSGLGGGLDTVR